MDELDSPYDPYRCPVCKHSLMRGNPSKGRRPGIYRAGYLGPWFACPMHGIVYPLHEERGEPPGFMWGNGDEAAAEWTEMHSDAVDLLKGYRAACPDERCERCTATDEYLTPILAALHEQALDDHCMHKKANDTGIRGSRGRCVVCTTYWQLIDGVWFRGSRAAVSAAS